MIHLKYYILSLDHARTIAKTKEQIQEEQNYKYAKKKIDEDESLTEQEKSDAIKTYMDKGFYEESVTKNVENQSSLTELKEKETPLTSQQAVDQVKIDHLDHLGTPWVNFWGKCMKPKMFIDKNAQLYTLMLMNGNWQGTPTC